MSKTLKIVIGIIVLVLIVGGIWYGVNKQKPKEEQALKIGVILPLSGSASYYGGQAQKGLEIARSELEAKYPNLKFQVYYEDSQYVPAKGVDAYNKLRNVDNINAVIPLASHVAIAIQSLANKDKVLEMAMASTSGKYSTPDDYAFRTIPSISVQTDKIAQFLKGNSFKKIAIFTAANDFGEGGKVALKSSIAPMSDIKVVSEQTFAADQKDFRTELLKIKNTNSDIVYLVGTATNYLSILMQAKEIGLDKQFISISSTEDPILVKDDKGYADGIIYTYYNISPENNEIAKSFVDKYKAKYGDMPDGYAAEAYEALKLVAGGFRNCSLSSDCAKTNLENLRDYPSVFGKLSFDKNGDVYYDFTMKTIKDGKFVPYEQ